MATGTKIIVVDDNDFIRIVVTKMLSRLGYEVSAADSGENGLSIFLKNIFDIVLSDYEMPGMDGVAFACSMPIEKRREIENQIDAFLVSFGR